MLIVFGLDNKGLVKMATHNSVGKVMKFVAGPRRAEHQVNWSLKGQVLGSLNVTSEILAKLN